MKNRIESDLPAARIIIYRWSSGKEENGMSQCFVFVPLTGDEVSAGPAHSTQIVRAHVTGRRHAKTNTRNAMQAKQPWTVIPYVPRGRSDAKHTQGSPANRVDTTKPEIPISGFARSKHCEENSSEPANDTVPTFPGSVRFRELFCAHPGEYQNSLAPIFAHYIENLAVDIPELDGAGQKGLLSRHRFPLAMTEPSSMYAILLLAAAHRVIVSPSNVHGIDLLSLKARALVELNSALGSSRALSDAVIGAVMTMAAYEATFGDTIAYAAHMQGLKLLIKMRGGLGELGLDGLLERMLVWIDLNAAHLTGSTRTIGDKDTPTMVNLGGPDPFRFTGLS